LFKISLLATTIILIGSEGTAVIDSLTLGSLVKSWVSIFLILITVLTVGVIVFGWSG
jgi:hypothetical protein